MEDKNEKCSIDCACTLPRRDFLKLLTLPALAPALPAIAGPFAPEDFDDVAPADKKLSPEWLHALTQRGRATIYRGGELEKIGMPVGGICAGQLYLGGDGRLWRWDIFNRTVGTADGNYARPPLPDFPLRQGFAIKATVNGRTDIHTLDKKGFSDITFCGEYPIGTVTYRDAATPLQVILEAFSPFIPLNTDDSSLPATVMNYRVKNTGKVPMQVELSGWLENAVAGDAGAMRQNQVLSEAGHTFLECSLAPLKTGENPREEIVFERFDKPVYDGWEATGTAFGTGPILRTDVPVYQGELGGPGPRVVNSHATAPGKDIGQKDGATGTLTSKPFVIERNFIRLWIGGGNHSGKTCINVLIDGKVVRTLTGHNNNRMRLDAIDVREFARQTARLQIVDNESGPWGNIGIGEIVFSDAPPITVTQRPDYGTMGIALLTPQPTDFALVNLLATDLPEATFPTGGTSAKIAQSGTLIGALGRKLTLKPDQEAQITFVLTWHFPNLELKDGGREYANRFPSAAAVARYVSEHFPRLAKETRLWRDTWYDSTLPYWFLDRSFLTASTLATSTAYRFKTGRFYGWEGVGCCEGTCTHVWHYAHAVARLFPDLERDLRERTDFGKALHTDSGVIEHRGESAGLAVDGQAGCILRAYREHQMSADSAFLKRLWPRVKSAMQCLIDMDPGEGILAGPQHNTLDQAWFGKVAWLSSLYIAAARACATMANEMGDTAFAVRCQTVFERGSKSIDAQLFNGEYYIQTADPAHQKTVGSYNGCEIDQVFGQSWAFQVGQGRLQSEAKIKTALRSLWKYNFTPDVGPFRKNRPVGRWYAMAGEGGLIMCSWPKGEGMRVPEGFDFYFNECMTGFEYQVAGHMIWEGMVPEGLAIVRMIHERYHAARRNPWNEIECGDHYARAMASYGVYLAACGYEYHGPKGHLAFAPRLTPEDFRAAFTAAEGWGTYTQKHDSDKRTHTITLKYGKLRLKSLAFAPTTTGKSSAVTVTLKNQRLPAEATVKNGQIHITLKTDTVLLPGQKLSVSVHG